MKPLVIFLCALFLACSSAPKRPAEVRSVRTMAETQLELVNKAIDQARYEAALEMLAECRRMAESVDDPSLRIRTGLSLGNILFYQGNREAAGAEWNAALAEAEAEKEPALAAASRVFIIRAGLLGGNIPPREAAAQVTAELPALKSEPLFTALGYTVRALAEKENQNWAGAEREAKSALEIHEKQNYLESAAYDWYIIASIRSVAGKPKEALEAVKNAIDFDRRAENTHGLGMDYRALGAVYEKTGETALAVQAYERSRGIFAGGGMDQEAARSQELRDAAGGGR